MRGDIADFSCVYAGDLDGVDAQFVSAEIDRLLDRPFRRWIAEAAKRAGGNLVCINQQRFRLNVRIFVASVVAHRGDSSDCGSFS